MTGAIVIHKRKSSKPTGTVEVDGVHVGYAVAKSRVAAMSVHPEGLQGQRMTFYTAVAAEEGERRRQYEWWAPGDGGSIGTRFRTRRDAAVALREFTRLRASYPDGRSGYWATWRAFQPIRKATWGF